MSDNSQENTSTTFIDSVATGAEPGPPSAVAPTVEVQPEIHTPADDKQPIESKDYSWVPAKFLRDGQPDFEAMTKSYTSLEKKIGQKGAFAPESVDEYVYEPKSIQLDAEANKAFKQFAKDNGLSTKQYAAVLEQYEQAVGQVAETPEKAKAHLTEAWGKDFDLHASNAKLAYETYVPSDIPIEAIGNNPYLLRVLANIGAELREDPTATKGAATASGTSIDEIRQLMGDKDYYKNDQKQALVAEWYSKNG